MQIFYRAILSITTILLGAGVVMAQTEGAQRAAQTTPAGPSRSDRVYVTFGGWYQPGEQSFSDRIRFTEYLETATMDATYRQRDAVTVEVAGAVRLWKGLAIGAGVTRFDRSGAANVQASIPHPFLFARPRSGGPIVQTDVTQREHIVRLEAVWVAPVGRRVLVLMSGGPAFLNVTQSLGSSLRWRERGYPYDDGVEVEGMELTRVTASKIGIAAAADVGFFFSRRVGVGAGVRVSRAKVRLANRIPLEVGGSHISAGLRLRLP